MATAPLMPKATAVWLVDNTSLSFDQIAQLCNLHPLEVKAIADGDAAQGIKGLDPVSTGQLTREEIATAEADHSHKLHLAEPKVRMPEAKPKKGPRYTPVSRRQDRPNAILWLVRNHPELKDSQIMRLVGTTKSTIAAIRERTHWNSANLTPLDPVTLGLCSQIDLDLEVHRAAKEKPLPVEEQGATLLPASVTTAPKEEPEPAARQVRRRTRCQRGVRQAQATRRQERVNRVIASQRPRAKSRGPMTRSAKQSSATRAALDCFVASLLAMTNPFRDGNPAAAAVPRRCSCRPSMFSAAAACPDATAAARNSRAPRRPSGRVRRRTR